MAVWELLSTEQHVDLRMCPASAAGRHFAQVIPSEFAAVAARCPILLTKHPDTGDFYAGAVSGFEVGENLIVDEQGTLDGFMPLDFERQGFFIADADIVIDREHARFKEGRLALFDEDGGVAEPLQRVQRALTDLNTGLQQSEAFIRSMLELHLIEPIDISLAFDDGRQIMLEGLYTISRDALGNLDDAAVLTLFRNGMLQFAHVMVASLKQIPLLARRRNRLLLD